VLAEFAVAGNLRGRRAFVNGIGMLGLIAVAVAKARDAAENIACDLASQLTNRIICRRPSTFLE